MQPIDAVGPHLPKIYQPGWHRPTTGAHIVVTPC